MAKAYTPEIFKTVTALLTTSGIKVLGILIALLILSQLSKRWEGNCGKGLKIDLMKKGFKSRSHTVS